jgi:hypothetical protein
MVLVLLYISLCPYELVLTTVGCQAVESADIQSIIIAYIHIFIDADNLQLPRAIVSYHLTKEEKHKPVFHGSLHKEHVAFRVKESDRQEATMKQATGRAT